MENYMCACGAFVPLQNKTIHNLRCKGAQDNESVSFERKEEPGHSGPSSSPSSSFIENTGTTSVNTQNVNATENQWACSRCTFLNTLASLACEMCGNHQQADGSRVQEVYDEDYGDGMRAPDPRQRGERLVGDERQFFPFGQIREENDVFSSSTSAAQINRVIASTIAGGMIGGLSAYANDRSFVRGAFEGASVGALTSSVFNEFESIANDMRESQTQRSSIHGQPGAHEDTGTFRSQGRIRVYGGEPLDFADMLRLVMSRTGYEGVDDMDYESLLARFGDGSANRGATEETLARIPTSTYELDQSSKDENDQASCAICLDSFGKGDEVSALPCGHSYHAGCIQRWLSNVASCPVCKKEVQ